MFFMKEILQNFMETKTSKVIFSGQGFSNRTKDKKGVPLVVTYNPGFKSNDKIIYYYLYLSYITEELKHLFIPGIMFLC